LSCSNGIAACCAKHPRFPAAIANPSIAPCLVFIASPSGRKLAAAGFIGGTQRILVAHSRPLSLSNFMCDRRQVGIHRQSRWLYVCWPLKGAFSQPSEAKARTKAKTWYCYLQCRSTGNSRENILPEFSKFYCHPGRAGGSPFWISNAPTRAGVSPFTSPLSNAWSDDETLADSLETWQVSSTGDGPERAVNRS